MRNGVRRGQNDRADSIAIGPERPEVAHWSRTAPDGTRRTLCFCKARSPCLEIANLEVEYMPIPAVESRVRLALQVVGV